MQWHIAPLSSPSPEGLFILILSDVSKLLMDFVVLVHKDIFAECNGYKSIHSIRYLYL